MNAGASIHSRFDTETSHALVNICKRKKETNFSIINIGK